MSDEKPDSEPDGEEPPAASDGEQPEPSAGEHPRAAAAEEPQRPAGDAEPAPVGDEHDHEDDHERRRLRRTGRHLVFTVAAVALFGLAFLGVYLWSQGREPPPGPGPSPSPSPTVVSDNLTVLIQAATRDGAMGNMLTAVQPDPQRARNLAVLLSMPHNLVVAAPGAEEQELATTIGSLDTLRPTAAVAATLGVHIDASWRLDRKAMAGLVDSVNSVTVNVTERLRIRDEDGQLVVTLRPGTQRLSGTIASWYAVGDVIGGTDSEQAERFADVLTKTLARLPDDDLAIRESLTALGTLAPSTIATQDLASYLAELAASIRQEAVTSATLPTTQFLAGPVALRWTDFTEATPLLRDMLPDSLWLAGTDGPPRVLVRVPPQRPGWTGYVRSVLAGAGFVFVDGRGMPDPQPRTTLLVRGDPVWALQLEKLLAIPRRATTVVAAPTVPPPRGLPWADADLTLGPDYVPGVGDPRVRSTASPTGASDTGGQATPAGRRTSR